jgi:hypothetical protein
MARSKSKHVRVRHLRALKAKRRRDAKKRAAKK